MYQEKGQATSIIPFWAMKPKFIPADIFSKNPVIALFQDFRGVNNHIFKKLLPAEEGI